MSPVKTLNMGERIIRYRLLGMSEEGGHLRFSAFLAQLQSLSAALKNVDKFVSGKPQATAYYRVVDLSHSSPAMICLKPVAIKPEEDNTEQIYDTFYSGWKSISEGKNDIPAFDRNTLEAFHSLISPLGKEFESAVLVSDDYEFELGDKAKENLRDLLSVEYSSYGTVEGKLESINLHNHANQFRIYPLVGPGLITCKFAKHLRDTAKDSLDKYVSVTGLLFYKNREKFPYKIDVEKIIVYPPKDKLPHLSDLRGIAPNATGDLSSADFVGLMRDAWQ